MNPTAIKNWGIAIAILLGLFVLYMIYKWFKTKGAGGVASDVAHTVANVATGAVSGVVKGIGETVDIPDTSQSKCDADIAAGKTFQASLDCPATTFIKSLFTGKSFSTQPLTGTGIGGGFIT